MQQGLFICLLHFPQQRKKHPTGIETVTNFAAAAAKEI